MNETICNGYVKQKINAVFVKFLAFHSNMIVSMILISYVHSSHIFIVFNTGRWTGVRHWTGRVIDTINDLEVLSEAEVI